jgi:hypothetical protein
MTKEQRKPLVYHWPSDRYGRGVCGTHGMMAGDASNVTCARCLRSANFLAASTVASRYQGQQP